jgi:hypothetical protein
MPGVVATAAAPATPAGATAIALAATALPSAAAADVAPPTDPATAEGLAVTPSGKGVWIVTADAAVADTGDATPVGPASGGSGPAVGIAATRA